MVIIKMPERNKPMFSRYIGIDYSGAETPVEWDQGMGSSLVIYSLCVVYPSPSSPVLDMPMSGLKKSIYY